MPEDAPSTSKRARSASQSQRQLLAGNRLKSTQVRLVQYMLLTDRPAALVCGGTKIDSPARRVLQLHHA